MDYFNDAKNLIGHARTSFQQIKRSYDESLTNKDIRPPLLIEIKNFMENLRSALDFTAHGLFDKYGDKNYTGDVYFPYAWKGLDRAGYRSKKIIEKIPGLEASRPDIAMKIESYQHFVGPDNSWLCIFMDLNNENKHQRLTPQIKKETRQLNIKSGGVSMSLGQGTSIIIGKDAFIKMGDAIIQDNQTIDVNSPAKIVGPAVQEIITWVSFCFSSNNEVVMPFLDQALVGVEKIVNELSII